MRALSNLPQSLHNFGRMAMQGLGPTSGPAPTKNPEAGKPDPEGNIQGEWSFPSPIASAKSTFSGLANVVRHPLEALAEDPVGTLTLGRAGLEAGRGLTKIPGMIPNAERAGKNFETVMQHAKDVPLDTGKFQTPLLRSQELREAGASMPGVLNKALKRTTTPGAEPLTYGKGRDISSIAGRLSGEENARMVPQMRGALNRFARGISDANREAAYKAGVGEIYDSAMNEYRRAMKMQDIGEAFGKGAKRAARAVPWALGAGAGGAVGYHLLRPFFGTER